MDKAVEPAPHTPLGFADQAYLGKNEWWRYALALGLLVGGLIGFWRFVAWVLPKPTLFLFSHGYINTATRPLIDFALEMLAVISMLPLMRGLFVVFHRRAWRSFITAKPRFDWLLFWRSLAVVLALCLGGLGLDFVYDPASFEPPSHLPQVLVFAPLALLLLPFQCLAEEVLFRGYIAQAVGRVSGSFAARLMIPALLFAAAHIGNPEWDYDRVWASAGYVLLASYLGLISLRGGGLEASLGVHLGNNIYGVLIVGSAVSASQGPTLWQTHQIDFRESFFVMIPVLGLHYLLVFRPWTKRRNPRESDCHRC